MLSDESEAKLPTGLWKLIGELIKASTELAFYMSPWDDIFSTVSEIRPQPKYCLLPALCMCVRPRKPKYT